MTSKSSVTVPIFDSFGIIHERVSQENLPEDDSRSERNQMETQKRASIFLLDLVQKISMFSLPDFWVGNKMYNVAVLGTTGECQTVESLVEEFKTLYPEELNQAKVFYLNGVHGEISTFTKAKFAIAISQDNPTVKFVHYTVKAFELRYIVIYFFLNRGWLCNRTVEVEVIARKVFGREAQPPWKIFLALTNDLKKIFLG